MWFNPVVNRLLLSVTYCNGTILLYVIIENVNIFLFHLCQKIMDEKKKKPKSHWWSLILKNYLTKFFSMLRNYQEKLLHIWKTMLPYWRRNSWRVAANVVTTKRNGRCYFIFHQCTYHMSKNVSTVHVANVMCHSAKPLFNMTFKAMPCCSCSIVAQMTYEMYMLSDAHAGHVLCL